MVDTLNELLIVPDGPLTTTSGKMITQTEVELRKQDVAMAKQREATRLEEKTIQLEKANSTSPELAKAVSEKGLAKRIQDATGAIWEWLWDPNTGTGIWKKLSDGAAQVSSFLEKPLTIVALGAGVGLLIMLGK